MAMQEVTIYEERAITVEIDAECPEFAAEIARVRYACGAYKKDFRNVDFPHAAFHADIDGIDTLVCEWPFTNTEAKLEEQRSLMNA